MHTYFRYSSVATPARDLTHLRLAIEGSVVMSAELQRTMDQLYDATVPEAWSRLAWGCSALGLFLCAWTRVRHAIR